MRTHHLLILVAAAIVAILAAVWARSIHEPVHTAGAGTLLVPGLEAKLNDVRIYRQIPNSANQEVIHVDVTAIKKNQKPDFVLQAYDVIEVSESGMFSKDLATMHKIKVDLASERRSKYRFPMQRELRYKLLKDGASCQAGVGETVDMGSGGIGFSIGHDLPVGAFIELSISWPVLLDSSCPMRLNVFGRVVRNENGKCACTIDKYEFRTQARALQRFLHAQEGARNDLFLRLCGVEVPREVEW